MTNKLTNLWWKNNKEKVKGSMKWGMPGHIKKKLKQYAEYTNPFCLHIDANELWLGVVLYQKQGEGPIRWWHLQVKC